MKLSKQINRLRLGMQDVRKRLPGHRPGIYYVVPKANWSIDWDGHYITKGVREQFDIDAQLTNDPRWLSGQILHYGSLWSFLGNLGAAHNNRNRVVVTVFHGSKDSGNKQMHAGIDALLGAQDSIDKLVVSNSKMEARFLKWGIPEEKLERIPLGVDLSVFQPVDSKEKKALRRQLNIADKVFCIGSFQKDGEGWEEGFEPKLIKGPDIFIAALDKLSKKHPLHVLLTGPARGYVKRELDNRGILFTHKLLDDYLDVAKMYAALDAYMVTSREEGGPKGILESLASGIPLISTRVGLAPDVIQNEKNALLVNSEDVQALVQQGLRIIEDKSLARKLVINGLSTIQKYDWMEIGKKYYEQVYSELIA